LLRKEQSPKNTQKQIVHTSKTYLIFITSNDGLDIRTTINHMGVYALRKFVDNRFFYIWLY